MLGKNPKTGNRASVIYGKKCQLGIAKVRICFIVSPIWKTQQSIPDPWFIFMKQKKFVKKNTQV